MEQIWIDVKVVDGLIQKLRNDGKEVRVIRNDIVNKAGANSVGLPTENGEDRSKNRQ